MSEQDIQEDNSYDDAEVRAEVSQEVAEQYGSPQPEEKINQFTILKEMINKKDSLRTTFLTRPELGKPMFSARFYLDCMKLCDMYGADLIKEYFANKVGTITDSGMSNEGFTPKLSVTNNRNVRRVHERKTNPDEEKAP